MDKFQNKYRIPSARLKSWDYRWKGAYFITICTKNRENYFGKIDSGHVILFPTGIIADIMWHEIKNHANNVELGEYIVMPNHLHGIVILTGNNSNIENWGGGSCNDNICIDNQCWDTPKDDHYTDIRCTDDHCGDIPCTDDHCGDIPCTDDHCRDIPCTDDHCRDIPCTDDCRDNYCRDVACNVSTINSTPTPTPVPPPAPNEFMASISPKSNSVSTIMRSYKSAVTKHAHRLGFKFEWHTRFHDHIIRNDAEYQRIANYIKTNPQRWSADEFNQ